MSSARAPQWTEVARDDLRRERAYLARHNKVAARGFLQGVKAALQTIREHPEAGRVHEDLLPRGRYRYMLIQRHQLIYRANEDGDPIIVRLWDARRNPESLAVGE